MKCRKSRNSTVPRHWRRVKIASAEVKEKEAQVEAAGATSSTAAVFRPQLEAAQARVELAQLMLDRCTLRAPFAGRVVALPVCAGQYVVKGTVIAELADISALKTLLPVDRRGITSGADLTVQVEGQDVAGKVQAIAPSAGEVIPLCASWPRRSPPPGSWSPIPRASSSRGCGSAPRRFRIAPVATIPKRALKHGDARHVESALVQVIRNEYVTDVPVRGAGRYRRRSGRRSPVCLRRTDALIVSSSVSLLAGTLVRFGDGSVPRGIEGVAPNPAVGGFDAGITGPAGARGRHGTAAGAGTGTAPRGGATTGTRPPNTPPASEAVPF